MAGLVAATGAPVAAVLGEEQKVTASDGASLDEFGASVAVSGDTVLVGVPGDDDGKGSAYVYSRAGGTGTEEQKLLASDGASLDEFGFSVAVSGGTALVGAPFDDNDNGVGAGSAYLYARA
ncbi:MAG TPA: FG-GAP repeat protein [Actinomycetota bacterium]|nr:FG-GAP repeat protein [Actinomycetota bacterium]